MNSVFCRSDTETQCEVMQEIVDLILEVSLHQQGEGLFSFSLVEQ